MESIFDHSPTNTEIQNFTRGLSKDEYLKRGNEILIADIAIMYLDRGFIQRSNMYWDKVPYLHKEFLLGFDDVIIPV